VNVINGLPAHVLLVHAVVVLAPLTALLLMLCGIVPAARRRLVWLVLVLAAVTAALTPLTTEAGEWFYDLLPQHSATLTEHANRGQWMIYFAGGLVVAALALVWLHVTERKAETRRTAANVIVAVLALAVGISTIVTVYRIGDSGAQATWQGVVPAAKR
jgi:p-aminobenzoyl-glutamate transporter AbgT